MNLIHVIGRNIKINNQRVFINPFSTSVPLLYPLIASENLRGFLIFSGGMEVEHWL